MNNKKLKDVFLPGTPVPVSIDVPVGNSVGTWAEDLLESRGFTVNRQKGPDLPDIEIKTRKMGTNSAMSLGNMTTTDIINTPWDNTSLKEKCKSITIVNWDEDRGEVVNIENIDLTDDFSQSCLGDCYENARQQIINGETTRTNTSDDVYFERKKGNSWKLRATAAGLKKIKSRAWSSKVLNDKELFPDA